MKKLTKLQLSRLTTLQAYFKDSKENTLFVGENEFMCSDMIKLIYSNASGIRVKCFDYQRGNWFATVIESSDINIIFRKGLKDIDFLTFYSRYILNK